MHMLSYNLDFQHLVETGVINSLTNADGFALNAQQKQQEINIMVFCNNFDG